MNKPKARSRQVSFRVLHSGGSGGLIPNTLTKHFLNLSISIIIFFYVKITNKNKFFIIFNQDYYNYFNCKTTTSVRKKDYWFIVIT